MHGAHGSVRPAQNTLAALPFILSAVLRAASIAQRKKPRQRRSDLLGNIALSSVLAAGSVLPFHTESCSARACRDAQGQGDSTREWRARESPAPHGTHSDECRRKEQQELRHSGCRDRL